MSDWHRHNPEAEDPFAAPQGGEEPLEVAGPDEDFGTITVEISGTYGEPDGQVNITDTATGEEIAMWASDEWIEDPSVVYAIVNAIRIGYEDGAGALREMVGGA